MTTSTLADASIIQPSISDGKQHYLWRISYEQPLTNLFIIDRPLALAMNQQINVEYNWNNNLLTSNSQSLVSGTVYQLLAEQVPNFVKADSPEVRSATTKKADKKHVRTTAPATQTTQPTRAWVMRPSAKVMPAQKNKPQILDTLSQQVLNGDVAQGYPMFSQADDDVTLVSFDKFKPIAKEHAGSPSLPPIERVQKIENWLKNDFTYSLDNTDVDRSKEPLMDFLVRRKHGHCEYFASALVALTRSLGFDSRVVGGFKGGEYNSFGEYYVVRNLDAHAWAEVWIEGQGWVRFDPTPAGRDQKIRQQDSKLFKWFWDFVDLMQYNWTDKVTSYDGSNRNEFMNSLNKQIADPNSHIEEDPWTLKNAWKWLVNLIRGRNYKSVWVQVLHFIIAIGVLTLLAFLFRIFVDVFMIMWTTIKQFVRRRWENRFGRLWYCPVDFYRKLLLWLAARGMTRKGTETADEFVDRVSLVRPDMEKVLRFVTKVYLAIRFGEKTINAKQRQHLIDQVESVETTIATTRLVSREVAVTDDKSKKVRKRVQDEKDPQLTNKDFDFRR
jgi:transglutaminase-like putative cysteine protease